MLLAMYVDDIISGASFIVRCPPAASDNVIKCQSGRSPPFREDQSSGQGL